MMKVPNGKANSQQPKDKGKSKARSKGTVQSASRSKSKDASFFVAEEDEPVDDYDDDAGGMEHADLDDIYNFNSPEKSEVVRPTRSAPIRSLPASPTKIRSVRVIAPPRPKPTEPATKTDQGKHSSDVDIHARCRQELMDLRSKVRLLFFATTITSSNEHISSQRLKRLRNKASFPIFAWIWRVCFFPMVGVDFLFYLAN